MKITEIWIWAHETIDDWDSHFSSKGWEQFTENSLHLPDLQSIHFSFNKADKMYDFCEDYMDAFEPVKGIVHFTNWETWSWDVDRFIKDWEPGEIFERPRTAYPYFSYYRPPKSHP